MDLSNLKNVDDPIKCVLVHPVTDEVLTDDDGQEMYISVYGKDSSEYKRTLNAHINKSLQKKGKSKSLDDSVKSAIELLASVTAEWNVQVGGDKPKCSKDEAIKLYSDWAWIKEQVDSFVHDRSNFFTS